MRRCSRRAPHAPRRAVEDARVCPGAKVGAPLSAGPAAGPETLGVGEAFTMQQQACETIEGSINAAQHSARSGCRHVRRISRASRVVLPGPDPASCNTTRGGCPDPGALVTNPAALLNPRVAAAVSGVSTRYVPESPRPQCSHWRRAQWAPGARRVCKMAQWWPHFSGVAVSDAACSTCQLD